MIRLFTAVEIPEGIRSDLHRLQGGIPGARWIDPENFHITMRFIGDVDEHLATDIDAALAPINAAAFQLRLTGVGQFGSNRRPRAIWAGIGDMAPLRALQAKQEAALQRIGLQPEPRKYMPHVTLARLRDIRRDAVNRWCEAHNLYESPPFEVTRVVLFSSKTSVGGGPYIPERLYDLAA